jgi:hypothetical protein
VAGEAFERCAEAGGIAGEPVSDELQQLGEFGRVSRVEG